MRKKYEILKNDKKVFLGRTLYRIRSLVTINSTVLPGDLGGYIEKESNLSEFGDAWVYGNAKVYNNAKVSDFFHISNITNQRFSLTLTPNQVFAGCRIFTKSEFLNLSLDQCESEWESWELENYKGYAKLFYERLEMLESKTKKEN